MCNHNSYRKIQSKKFIEKLQNISWECVLDKNIDDPEALKNSCILLKHFSGCFIKADGIICKLKKVKLPPAWSCILFDDSGMQWFALGGYFNIYLPVKIKHD